MTYCYTWNMPVLLPSKVFSRNGMMDGRFVNNIYIQFCCCRRIFGHQMNCEATDHDLYGVYMHDIHEGREADMDRNNKSPEIGEITNEDNTTTNCVFSNESHVFRMGTIFNSMVLTVTPETCPCLCHRRFSHATVYTVHTNNRKKLYCHSFRPRH
jgi:hypothetical protein